MTAQTCSKCGLIEFGSGPWIAKFKSFEDQGGVDLHDCIVNLGVLTGPNASKLCNIIQGENIDYKDKGLEKLKMCSMAPLSFSNRWINKPLDSGVALAKETFDETQVNKIDCLMNQIYPIYQNLMFRLLN
jgi:hypothetical protein